MKGRGHDVQRNSEWVQEKGKRKTMMVNEYGRCIF